MRAMPFAVLGIVAALAVSPARAKDPAALLANWATAYSAGPQAEVPRLCTSDARIWSEFSPREGRGIEDVAHYFATISLGPSPARARIDAYEAREIGPVILVSGRSTLLRERWDGSMAEEPCRFTLTLLRQPDGGWRIADQHVSRLPAMP